MKITYLVLFLSLIITSGYSQKKEQPNHFSSSIDTIIIKTEKVKGAGLFPSMYGQIYFHDTTEYYNYPVIFPNGIYNIKLASQFIDLKPYRFDRYRNGKMNISYIIKDIIDNKIDTLNIPTEKDNNINIMSGQRDNKKIFIVDQNNNKDFRDDSVRIYPKTDQPSEGGLIKCKYKIYNGEKIIEDSSWLSIGTIQRGAELWKTVSHHLTSTFSIDKDKYQIGIFDHQSNFTYDDPMTAIISQNGIKKDSLLKSEIFDKGEYLKLGDNYFRFEDITNDGSYITLVKENKFENKVGTQVGMIAPDFTSKTITGDTVSLKNYKGQFLLLANLTACWSKISSYEYYKNLTKSFNDELNFIGIDNSTESLPINIKNLKLPGHFIFAEENNDEIQKFYRPDFSSRTCFLINQEGRIIDKFEISDWEKSLMNHLKKEE